MVRQKRMTHGSRCSHARPNARDHRRRARCPETHPSTGGMNIGHHELGVASHSHQLRLLVTESHA